MKVGVSLALGIAITGQVLYHVTQKSVSAGTHPVVALIAFYLLAAALSLPLLWLFPLDAPLIEEVGRLNGAVYGVAASIVLIEVGFLLAYRAGGNLSNSFVLTASAVTVTLFLVGLLALGERTSATQIAGIGLCLAGVWLVSRPAVAGP
jgi:drug/metabolite transporter (DMT)-like permease